MSWTEPSRTRICRDSFGRPVDLIVFADGEPLVQVGNVANIPLSSLKQGLQDIGEKTERAS